MIKLLYITNGISGSGGLERVLSVKCSLLAEDYRYEVTILTLNEPNPRPFYPISGKVHFFNLPFSGNKEVISGAYFRRLGEVVNRLKPDVISVCDDGLKGFLIPRLIKPSVPIIYERHASVNLNTNKWFGGLLRTVMRALGKSFDRFVVLTPSNIPEWGMANVIAIPNPLPFSPKRLSTQENKKVVAVGSLNYNKGYDLLLRAWSIVERNNPDWSLDIYGKDNAGGEYQKLSETLFLSSVRFHEPIASIQEAYSDASIHVLPSRSEGFGMVIIEAMSCGLPSVSFDCPSGPRDIITDGRDGFLVEAENYSLLADKLSGLMNDPEKRILMGQEALKKAALYAPSRIVSLWDILFQNLIAGNSKNQIHAD